MMKSVALTCALLLAALIVWLRLGAMLKSSIDYPQFYFAGQLVQSGQASKLHDTAAYEPLLEAAGLRRGALSTYFNRPAYAALVYSPLALFSFEHGRYVFVAINVVIWALLVWKLPRWLDAPGHLRVGLFCFFPFIGAVGTCQDTLLVTLTTAYACCVLLKRNETAAGIVLSLGLFKPHLLILMPFLLFLEGRRRALWSFLLSGSVLGLVSVAMVGPKGIAQWLALLAAPSTDMMPEVMANIRALGLNLGLPAALGIGLLVVAGTATVLVRGSYEQRLSVTILATLLFCPHTYSQDFSLASVVALASSNPLIRYGFLIPWAYFLPSGTATPIIVFAAVAVTAIALQCMPIRQIRNTALSQENV
jgi:hypothetical protein